MRLGYLFAYITVMWTLVVIGGFVLVKVVAPFHLDGNEIVESVLKATIAVSMVTLWIWIMIGLKNYYVKRRLVSDHR